MQLFLSTSVPIVGAATCPDWTILDLLAQIKQQIVEPVLLQNQITLERLPQLKRKEMEGKESGHGVPLCIFRPVSDALAWGSTLHQARSGCELEGTGILLPTACHFLLGPTWLLDTANSVSQPDLADWHWTEVTILLASLSALSPSR